jgi:hypothetical protein
LPSVAAPGERSRVSVRVEFAATLSVEVRVAAASSSAPRATAPYQAPGTDGVLAEADRHIAEIIAANVGRAPAKPRAGA